MPSAAYLACGYCLWVYQTLDAVDGKQARRTGSSTPLGQLFDHGLFFVFANGRMHQYVKITFSLLLHRRISNIIQIILRSLRLGRCLDGQLPGYGTLCAAPRCELLVPPQTQLP